jgi:hypothetical protein
MEQKLGVSRLTPIPGPEGEVSFEAEDDDQAQAYVRTHFLHRLQNCVRAELSSMAIVHDSSGSVTRLIDDSLMNPYFQEAYIRYDARSKQIEIDFVSTTTSMLISAFERTAM